MEVKLYTLLGKIIRSNGTGQHSVLWITTHKGISLTIRRGNASDEQLKECMHKWSFIEVLANRSYYSFYDFIAAPEHVIARIESKEMT